MKVQNFGMFVVLVILVLSAVFKDAWFNAITEHTRSADNQSNIVFLELKKGE